MQLFEQIEQLAKVASFQVQEKLMHEALDRGELYMPRKRPGVGLSVVRIAFWQAHSVYHEDKTLLAFEPKSEDEEQDKFKRMLTTVSYQTLWRVTGRAPPEDDVHIMRNILGRIFAYRKNGKFDSESQTIAIKLGLIKQETR
jgi:hypothetical protein